MTDVANRTIASPRLRPALLVEFNDLAIKRDLLVRRIGRIALHVTPLFAYFFLWAPIAVLIVFSFNAGASVSTWQGFTTQWYSNIFNNAISAGSEAGRFSTTLMLNALRNSLLVSFSATFISTVIGTMVALSLARGSFPGKKVLDAVLYLPVVIPEITQAISLAVFFKVLFDFFGTLTGTRITTGFGTIIIAHVAFCLSYVVIVVRARLADMNPRLEEAARDLGANEWQTFWRVTFPLILPGVVAGALLAFTISLDDFVVTFFNAGIGTTTLPIFVYGMLKTRVPPEINAISTLMLLASTVLVGISLAMQGRRAARSA
ncbi:MAG: ABC transporter permease [Aggregatilineales bacterium]